MEEVASTDGTTDALDAEVGYYAARNGNSCHQQRTMPWAIGFGDDLKGGELLPNLCFGHDSATCMTRATRRGTSK